MKKLIVFFLFFLVFSYAIYSSIKIATTFAPDFSIFYKSAQDILHTASPYKDKTLFTAFNYPAITAVLFIPFALLPFQQAQILFTILSLIAAELSIYFSFKISKNSLTLTSFLFVSSLVFLSFPTKFTLGMGQTNLIAYAFLLAGFLVYRKRTISSLIFLLFAVVLKPILGITFLVFLLEKDWKYFLQIVALSFLVILGVPFVLQQPDANTLFLQNVFHQSLAGREVYYNQGILGFISRLIQNLNVRLLLNVAATVTVIGITAVKIWKARYPEKISLLLTTLVIIDPLSWQHHFVFLLLPFVTVWILIQKHKHNQLWFYLLYGLAYILVSWNFKNSQQLNAFPFNLFLSNQFYAGLILFGLQVQLL